MRARPAARPTTSRNTNVSIQRSVPRTLVTPFRGWASSNAADTGAAFTGLTVTPNTYIRIWTPSTVTVTSCWPVVPAATACSSAPLGSFTLDSDWVEYGDPFGNTSCSYAGAPFFGEPCGNRWCSTRWPDARIVAACARSELSTWLSSRLRTAKYEIRIAIATETATAEAAMMLMRRRSGTASALSPKSDGNLAASGRA